MISKDDYGGFGNLRRTKIQSINSYILELVSQLDQSTIIFTWRMANLNRKRLKLLEFWPFLD